jgi:hypothetical protein
MASRRLVIALLVCLVATSAWADAFSEVPPGHWAYGTCAELAAAGVLSSDRVGSSSTSPALTRLELAAAVLEPLSDVDRALRALPPKADTKAMRAAAAAGLHLNPRADDRAIAEAAGNLAKLAVEFREELQTLGFDPAVARRGLELLESAPAVQQWRAEALAYAPARPAGRPSALTDGDLKFPIGRGAVAFSYNEGTAAPRVMNYAAMAAPHNLAARNVTSAGTSLAEPITSRLHTAYEYGLGQAVTVGLGYEEVARRGAGDLPLDAASLTTLGVGVRLTPSTSVKLSYSLFDYQSYVPDTPPLRELLAETSVSVEF